MWRQRLEKINWNFQESESYPLSIHRLHRFPGNFLPQIPRTIIEILTSPGQVVFDPFCGSGTSVIEAALLGRRAAAADINRAAIQIVTGKSTILRERDVPAEARRFHRMLDNPASFLKTGRNDYDYRRSGLLQEWIHKDTLHQLECIWQLIRETPINLRPALELVFFDVLFSVASTRGMLTRGGKPRRHHWGWIADNVRPKRPVWHDAAGYFRRSLVDCANVSDYIAKRHTNAEAARIGVFRGDARNVAVKNNAVDLLVTSPPYIGMVDYALANRLMYYWQGWDMRLDRQLEFGSRRDRNRVSFTREYTAIVESVAPRLYEVITPGGFVAIVLGASRKYPNVATEALGIIARPFKETWGPVARTSSRSRIGERAGRKFKEWIMVCRKEG